MGKAGGTTHSEEGELSTTQLTTTQLTTTKLTTTQLTTKLYKIRENMCAGSGHLRIAVRDNCIFLSD